MILPISLRYRGDCVRDVEIIAASDFKLKIAETDYLAPYVPDRDREPIWDGSIYVYSSKDKKNEHILGRVPVQIKGRTVKKLPKDKITFEETLSNMINFRKDGGVIYIIEKITHDNQKKMYYAKLMPFYINRLIGIAKNRGKVRFTLSVFPVEKEKIETLFFGFLKDRGKQPTSQGGHNWTVEEIVNQFRNEDWKFEFSIPVHGYNPYDPMSYLLDDNDVYLYVHHLPTDQFYAIDHISNVDVGCQEVDIKIGANGNEYYHNAIFERRKSGDVYLRFGNAFKIKFISDEQNLKFNYNLQGNLDEQITAISFLIDLVEDGGFYINDYKTEAKLDELHMLDIDKNKQNLKYLKDIKRMLDEVGVNISMEMGEFTDKEEDFIKYLILAFVYGKNLNFKDQIIPYIATMKFSNIRIALVFEKKENGYYKLYNFFDKKCAFTIDKEGTIPTSQYTIFRRDDYLTISNMNLDVLKKSYMEYDNEEHINRVNLSILEMIQAYDMDTTRTDLLEAAKELSLWLSDINEPNSIYALNYLQCVKRVREFNNDEIKMLNKIASAEPENKAIQFGVQVLFNNLRSASMFLDEMEAKEREGIMSTPINNLYEKKVNISGVSAEKE